MTQKKTMAPPLPRGSMKRLSKDLAIPSPEPKKAGKSLEDQLDAHGLPGDDVFSQDDYIDIGAEDDPFS